MINRGGEEEGRFLFKKHVLVEGRERLCCVWKGVALLTSTQVRW